MRLFIILLAVGLLLYSCSSYQYLTVSADRFDKNDRKELVWENDTVMIRFNFNGSWGRFSMSSMNKTNDPISLNWLKSAVVYQGKAYSLFDESITIEGDIQRNRLYPRRDNLITPAPSATVKAGFQVPREMDFMPPQSAVSRENIDISRIALETQALNADLPVEKLSDDGITIRYRQTNFDAATSPVKFTIYLTFVDSAGKEFYFQQPFYVSEIRETDHSSLHQVLINGDGDKFYWKLKQ